jgi:hypothetical protein
MSERTLDIFTNDRKVGTLREENDLWRFDYKPASGKPAPASRLRS